MKTNITADDDMETLPRGKHTVVIGQGTPIQLGLITTLLGLCVGGFAIWIWWAATITAKMDTVLVNQAAEKITISTLALDVQELKTWRVKIDATGSEALGARVGKLEDAVQKQSEWQKLHAVTQEKSKY